jgi:hypothetical protein
VRGEVDCGGGVVVRASGRVVPQPGSMWDRGWRPPTEAQWTALREKARRCCAARARHGILDLDDPEPGADLLGRIERQHTGGLDDGGWLDRLEAIERVTNRLAALRAEAIAGFDDTTRGISADLGHDRPDAADRPSQPGERRWHGGLLRSVSDELGLILGTGRAAAETRTVRSWELVHNYPATHAALAAGDLTEHAAFTLVDQLRALTDDTQVAAAETALLEWARTHPLHRFKQQARREVARRDAEATDRIHRRRLRDRAIRMHTDDAGVAELISTHDAVDAAAVMTSLTQAAQHARRHGDSRTLDQLRTDIALTRMLGQRGTGGATGKPASGTSTDGASGRPARGTGTETGTGTGTGTGTETDNTAGSSGATGRPAGDMGTGKGGGSGDATDSGMGPQMATAPEAATVPRVAAEVVIHATGAEIDAILASAPGTGGEITGHGLLPQATLIAALAQVADGNTPRTTARTTGSAAVVAAVRSTTRATERSTTRTATRSAARSAGSRSTRIRWHRTDRPPPSDPDQYVPSRHLDQWVRDRDRHCQFPGCGQAATRCDLDHRQPFDPSDPDGGRTTAGNLHALCRHHHRLKHRGGWKLRHNADGTTTWTSPTGRTYLSDPGDP